LRTTINELKKESFSASTISLQIPQLRFPEWERDDAGFQATLRCRFAERVVAVQPEFLLQNGKPKAVNHKGHWSTPLK
jgi:hypothetical protein